MSGSNHHMSPCRSDFGAFEIKQEDHSDSRDSNLDSIVRNCEQDEGDYSAKDDQVTVKKETDSSENEVEPSQGSERLGRSGRPGFTFPMRIEPLNVSSLSEGFGFIRSCLNVVLNVDSEKRQELVRAISYKLKYIEAVTTGKKLSKAAFIAEPGKPISCVLTKLIKVESKASSPRYNSNESEREEKTDNETDDEMVRRAKKSHYASNSVQVGLVRPFGDGSVQCNVCDRIINNPRGVCAACSSYVSRMRMKCRETGTPLPSCYHRDFKGGSSCNSCRLRKYVMLSKKETPPPTRRRWKDFRSKPARVFSKVTRKVRGLKRGQTEPQKCIVCERKSPWFKSWRCSACFVFHTRLIARYQAGDELPECDHDGQYAGIGCKGCRRIRLQRESALREPELAARLPEMHIKNAAHSDQIMIGDQPAKDEEQHV